MNKLYKAIGVVLMIVFIPLILVIPLWSDLTIVGVARQWFDVIKGFVGIDSEGW